MSQVISDQQSEAYVNPAPMYQHFNQVKERISAVEAIDYFFAKEMLTALVSQNGQSIQVENSTQVIFSLEQRANLTHLFLALSASLRAGHSCLPLSEIAGKHWGKSYVHNNNEARAGNNFELEQNKCLVHAGFVFASFTQLQSILTALEITQNDNQLLVFTDNNLYLRRYFQFESDLGKAINSRLTQSEEFGHEAIANCIDKLFPRSTKHDNASNELDWQKIAVANAINKNFSVIAGGPGTGKTYTVTKLLAALVMLQQTAQQGSRTDANTDLNIALVAPTGKAAQRLSESIIDAVAGFKGLIDDKVLAKIPTKAQTIHRLLGVLPNVPNFKHQQENQLSFDIVLIDEVSMVDLPLMTRTFRALRSDAKVILLGDADQLPSVAAGSILTDIAPRPHGGFSRNNNDYLNHVCQLPPKQLEEAFSKNKADKETHFDYLTFLVKSRRFDGKGGIGLLAKAVIQGDVKSSWQLLNQKVKEDAQLSLAQGELSQWLAPLVKQYYQPLESCNDVKDAFSLLSKFRVLCATRQGNYGVEQLNEIIKTYLGKNNSPYQHSQKSFYHGQPIMINENDYSLGLYNGDIGIIWRVLDQEGTSHLMACFESAEGVNVGVKMSGQPQQGIREILPSRLPKFESVYAMTIHKTQGSEFDHVAMVISAAQTEQQDKDNKGSKLLSRELLYTGITRAKKLLTISSNQAVWQHGVLAQIQRHSGLRLCAKP